MVVLNYAQENNNSGKQQFYLVSVIADKLIYFIYITRTNFRSDIVGDLE